ncbi:transposase, partial [Escherichia coli]
AQSLNANLLNWLLTRTTRWQMPPKLWMLAFPQ